MMDKDFFGDKLSSCYQRLRFNANIMCSYDGRLNVSSVMCMECLEKGSALNLWKSLIEELFYF